MAVGYIDRAVLGDIANAIRRQAGSPRKLKPAEMAAAVAALDGTSEGTPISYESGAGHGVVSERVFSGIADAIRAQTGGTETYRPGDMAAAILALSWDTGLKPRAVLLGDGTLELNYLDGRRGANGGIVLGAWEVPAAGFAKEADRGWDDASWRQQVERVVVDASFAGAGVTSADYWFKGFMALTEVRGFENLQGVKSFKMTFSSCGALESIYATSFDAAGATGSLPFGSCSRLVGGTGFVPAQTTGVSALKLGDGGVLTDPTADARAWVWGTVYDDGVLEVSASGAVDASRGILAHGRACTIANYRLASGLPWHDAKGSFSRVEFMADMEQVEYLNMDYWFYSYGGISSFAGLGHLKHVFDMAFCFASCTGVETLDLRGFLPASLADLTYAFSSCNALTTILADASWELPASGLDTYQTFYSSAALVGGNETAWSKDAVSGAYLRIDCEGEPGYLTAG